MNDSGGARVQEGIDSRSGYGKVFYPNVMLSQCPRFLISAVRAVRLRPALTDFIIQTRRRRCSLPAPGD